MANGQLNGVIHHLRKLVGWQDIGQLSDGQLLERFIKTQDAVAFEGLMQRHGPMVLGVCRRVLHHAQDAEDAFQATFLVLVKKADSIRPRDMVGNWLYGVAFRAALKARSLIFKRRSKESLMASLTEHVSDGAPQELWNDVQAVLDEELERLPDKYRAPVVLCELEGRSRREVAERLRIPEGTLSSRLASARKMLGRKLSRRGLALPAGVLATLFAEHSASAAVPATLMSATLKAVQLASAGQLLSAGVVSSQVAAVTDGVLKAMFLAKVKLAAVVVLAIGLFTGGSTYFVQREASAQAALEAPDPTGVQEPPVREPLKQPEKPKAEVARLDAKIPEAPKTADPPPEETFKQRQKKRDDDIIKNRVASLEDLDAEEKKVAESIKKEQMRVKLGDMQAFARLQKLNREKLLLAEDRNHIQAGIAVGGTRSIAPPLPTAEQRLGVVVSVPHPALVKQLGLARHHGVVIEKVDTNSPAARAGLLMHDILLKIDGRNVPSERKDFKKFLAEIRTDMPLEIVVLREGKEQTIAGMIMPALAGK